MMTAGGVSRTPLGGGWNALDQKPVSILQLEAAILVAQAGNPTIGQVPLPDGSSHPAQFETFGKVFRPIRDLEPWLVGATGVADVGVVLAAKPRTASAHWLRMSSAAEAVHEALIAQHIQYDIIRLDKDISGYKCIVLAEQTALSDAEIEKLRSYVRDGGRLIAAGNASLFDEHGHRRDDFGLANVFGVNYAGPVPADFIYLSLKDERLQSAVTPQVILIDQIGIATSLAGGTELGVAAEPAARRTDATTVLWGDAPPQWTHSHPGLVENRFGDGTSRYLAFPVRCDGVPNLWLKRLARHTSFRCRQQPLLTITPAPASRSLSTGSRGASSCICAITMPAIQRDYLSATSCRWCRASRATRSGVARPAPGVANVHVAPAGEAIYEVDGDALSIAVPDFAIHVVIVIE